MEHTQFDQVADFSKPGIYWQYVVPQGKQDALTQEAKAIR